MISKNTIKLIKSLGYKKYRQKENLFLVEGDKIVSEVLKSNFHIVQLYATQSFLHMNFTSLSKAKSVFEVSKDEIDHASLLKAPQNSLALCELPNNLFFPETIDQLAIFLDGIQDPGNLGTIIRICDWFGIHQLFCSPDTVDVFNPKVIQATMGSFCRVSIRSAEFTKILQLVEKSKITVVGSFMTGENIYQAKLPQKALLVMGNEGKGIRKEIEQHIERKITIPSFTTEAESLNVAVATAIVCSEFKRRAGNFIQNEMKG